jgi:hypothetical protein
MPLHAAVHLPQDGVGNCRHFAQLLKSQAQRLGAVFRFDSPVAGLVRGPTPAGLAGGEATGHRRRGGLCRCAGQCRAGAVGLRLPLAAVHGYSITAPCATPRAPDPWARARPDGRALQGHHLAPGSACACGRRRGDGWPPSTAHGRAGHALQGAGRLVSGRGPRARSAALERRTPHAARRPRRAGRQPGARGLAQPGPRLQRLDAGLRLGLRAGRSGQRAAGPLDCRAWVWRLRLRAG